MDILHERFEDMIISRGGDMNWPPRSYNLMPLDFFLWGYLNSQIYMNKPQTIDALKVNITNPSSKFSQIYARKSSKIESPEYMSPSEAADNWATYIPYLMP